MSSNTADGHLQYANDRAVAGGTEVVRNHMVVKEF
jgi:hypothetical protein